MITLNTPVSKLTRVGAQTAKRLNELGIFTAKDLLFYFPFRYDDFSRILPIKEALQTSGPVTIKCVIEMIESHRSPRQHKLYVEALVSDDSGKIKVIWFNQPFIKKILKPGDIVYLSGKINWDFWGVQMTNPVYEKAGERDLLHTGRIVPIYPLTEKLTQKQIRFLIKLVLPLRYEVVDSLPPRLRQNLDILDLKTALQFIHFPKNKEEAENAAKRFKFEELFYLQLENELSRLELTQEKAPRIKFFERETKEFVKSLPFELTKAQRKAAWEILKDLGAQKNFVHPMNRLLNGDVGSGKTVVAALAILNIARNGFQSAFMAPTEILAIQHFNTFLNFFRNFDVKIGLLTRSFYKIGYKGEVENTTKNKLIQDIKDGNLDLIIGTHTLISTQGGGANSENYKRRSSVQEGVNFKNLALAIIDEQHRFGVLQRAQLIRRSEQINAQNYYNASNSLSNSSLSNFSFTPHFLSMTATPIPRTLALIAYGDLDISILDEIPKGRKKVETKLVQPEFRAEAYNFVRHEIKTGRQAFVICPLIDPSDKLGVRSVKEVYERLKNDVFPDFKIEVLHGKMKSKEKDKIMENFKKGEIDILISTTVVEVGVDVPNATLMLIENAERFGLAQLHQLRGRVGRGEYQSYCLVFLESSSEEANKRLKIFAQTQNGFELAEQDLKFRGPGDILGVRQSGLPTLKFANLDDIELLKLARDEAKKFIAEDSEFKNAPFLKQELEKRRREVHLE